MICPVTGGVSLGAGGDVTDKQDLGLGRVLFTPQVKKW
jgi:hypothetical protein